MFDLQGKKVLVMGLGLHGGGVSVVKYLMSVGAEVTITDTKSLEELDKSVAELADVPEVLARSTFGKHVETDFINKDIVVPNPGVPRDSHYLSIAREHGADIYNEAALFFLLCQRPIIAVTGTRGKSTTATLIRDMLLSVMPDVILAGNIRDTAMFDIVGRTLQKSEVPVVLELSSWQVEGLSEIPYRPYIAVITNLYPDHLNTYPNTDKYYNAKFLLCLGGERNPRYTILNYDNEEIRTRAKRLTSEIIWVSSTDESHLSSGLYLSGSEIFDAQTKESLLRIPETLSLPHMKKNILTAFAAARVFPVSKRSAEEALEHFRPLRGRQEVVRTIDSVTFINDTNATSPEATVALVEGSYPHKLIIILGGASKNLRYDSFIPFLASRAKALIFLPGEATNEMKRFLPKNGIQSADANDLQQAIAHARSFSEPGDTIALSPAAASFNMFKNEFDRGDQFVQLVQSLT